MNLTAHIARHPIADDAYLRHLRTADVFQEVTEARDALRRAIRCKVAADGVHGCALNRFEAAKAKAALMASMEGL